MPRSTSYGLPALNWNNMEQVESHMEAANEVNSPVLSCRRQQVLDKYAGSHVCVIDRGRY